MEIFKQDVWFIILFGAIAIFCIALALVVKLATKRSLLGERERVGGVRKWIEEKERKLASTPGALSPKTYKSLLAIIPTSLGVIGYLISKSFPVTMAAVGIGLFVPEIVSRVMANAEEAAFEAKYERALRDMTASLRAGMSIHQSVQQICQSPFIDERIRKEFRRIDSDIKVGKSIKEAFQGMGERTSTQDTRDVATAISFQNEVGGSEADIIENIARSISSRISQRKEIKSLFSGTTSTVNIMSILPFAILVLFVLGMDDVRAYYFGSIQNFLILIAVASVMVVGVLLTRRLAKSAKRVRR